jgi:hypothetical protein
MVPDFRQEIKKIYFFELELEIPFFKGMTISFDLSTL